MPELPEVETTRRGIAPYLEKATILDAEIRQFSLRWPIEQNLANILKNQTVSTVQTSC